MAYDRAGDLFGHAGFAGSALQTNRDVADEEVAKDFVHELRRCQSNEDYAAWAKRWGDAAAERLLETSNLGDDPISGEHAEELLKTLRDRKVAIEEAADTVLNDLREIAESLVDKVEQASRALNTFEAVLRQHQETES